MKHTLQKWAMTIFSSVAFLVTVRIVNMTCVFAGHQPKQPSSLDKFRAHR